jgi:fimbrial chaperone protein
MHHVLQNIAMKPVNWSDTMIYFFKKGIMMLKLIASALNFFVKWAIISLLFLPLSSSPAFAADFQIQPTSLELSGQVKSGAFSVINNGNDKLNVQISVMEWNQDAEGKDVYGEAGDIVFFPKIMTVEPNEQRAVRIGIKGPPSLKEKTYRLFIEEIPSQKKSQDIKVSGKITAGLTIAFRYATPIFVKPVLQQESGVMERAEMSKGIVRAFVKNTGNIHIKLLKVTFQGKAVDGKELFSKELAGWYILHGLSRPYEVTVPQEICGNLSTIEINAQSENFNINGSLDVHKEMCDR